LHGKKQTVQTRFCFGLLRTSSEYLKAWNSDTCEHTDDGDHDHEFDQAETCLAAGDFACVNGAKK
jgi:hypothetical protein